MSTLGWIIGIIVALIFLFIVLRIKQSKDSGDWDSSDGNFFSKALNACCNRS